MNAASGRVSGQRRTRALQDERYIEQIPFILPLLGASYRTPQGGTFVPSYDFLWKLRRTVFDLVVSKVRLFDICSVLAEKFKVWKVRKFNVRLC